MNVHNCIRCDNPINYDDTDWCDVCDMSVFDDRMIKQTKMLTIENEKKLLGTKLMGSGSAEWVVTSIKPHLNHYVIFIEQTENGWDKKLILDRSVYPFKIGYQYKLECGSEKKYVHRNDIKNIDMFSNHLESFI
jgi:hypothetical protein